jgi:hypothetical protein
MAIGSYAKSNGVELTLAESWNGAAGANVSAPNPKGSTGTYPASVSCSATAVCASVGYFQGASASLGLAEGWNGTAWAVHPTPNPAAGDSDYLAGVSCTSASACVAVGDSQNSAGLTTALSEAWNGKAWATVKAAAPTGASSAVLSWVSCSSPSACTAVGNYQKGSNTLTLAERWNGKAWTMETVPNS